MQKGPEHGGTRRKEEEGQLLFLIAIQSLYLVILFIASSSVSVYKINKFAPRALWHCFRIRGVYLLHSFPIWGKKM